MPKAKKESWIKLYRSIIDWEWYKDPITKAVFLHLLLTANIYETRYRGVEVKRGQVATTVKELSATTGATYRQTRTALERLQMTNEVTITKHSKYSLFTVVNYELYQANRQPECNSLDNQNVTQMTTKRQPECHSLDNDLTITSPGYIINNKRKKEIKNNNAGARENENQNQNAHADGSDLLLESSPPVAVPEVGETVYFTNSAGEKVSHVWREKDSLRFQQYGYDDVERYILEMT